MFSPLIVASANFEERLVRADGAWTTLHRHAAPVAAPQPWVSSPDGPRRPVVATRGAPSLAPLRVALSSLPAGGDVVTARLPLLVNAHVVFSWLAADNLADPFVFTDEDGDQLLCVIDGGASLDTPCGVLRVNAAEHVFIPRAMPHRIKVDKLGLRAVVMELRGELTVPRHHRNAYGQFVEHAPFSQRDLHVPTWFARSHVAATGVPCLLRRAGEAWQSTTVIDPLATTGWEGAVYPVSFGWEVPLSRARGNEVRFFEHPQVTVSARALVEAETRRVFGVERVSLFLDDEGLPVLEWVPSGVFAPSPPPGGMAIDWWLNEALSLSASGVMALREDRKDV